MCSRLAKVSNVPRYFFDVRDGECIPDKIGTVLADVTQARNQAARLAGELLSQNPDVFWDDDAWVVEVSDETRLVLFVLTISAQDAPAMVRQAAH